MLDHEREPQKQDTNQESTENKGQRWSALSSFDNARPHHTIRIPAGSETWLASLDTPAAPKSGNGIKKGPGTAALPHNCLPYCLLCTVRPIAQRVTSM